MMLSCLGTLDRVIKGLIGRGGGKDDQQGRPTGTGGPVQHDFESASASTISLP